MTAVLASQLACKRGPPQRCEAVAFAERAQAAELGVDEEYPSAGLDRDVVDVEVPRGVSDPGNVEPVATVMEEPGLEGVLETPQLVEGIHPQGLAIPPQTHAAVEGTLENRELAIGAQANE